MAGTEYQATDVARIRTVLDATLAATIGATLTFDGFFGPGEVMPRTGQQPVHVDDGNPRGAVAWDLDYTESVEELLSGAKRSRRMAIRFQVRRQPDPEGVTTVYDDVLTVKQEISDRFEDLYAANGISPYAAQPLFPVGLIEGWPEYGFFLPVWSD